MSNQSTYNALFRGDTNSELLNRKQAAAYLGITEGTLAVWASLKRYPLPYVKMGRLVKYRRADLDAFIAGHVIKQQEL